MSDPLSVLASAERDAAVRAFVEHMGGRWRGGAGFCRCPAHDDHRPSLSVRAGRNRLLVKCFAGCSAADVLRAVRRAGYGDALSTCAHSPSAQASADHRASAALRLWGRARPAEGTHADRYLVSRGLGPPHPQARYLARTPLGTGPDLRFLPALLVAVRGPSGLVAVQRTFLDPTSPRKLAIEAPRRSLGALRDGAVRLASPGPVLGLAEGYETARAAMQALGMPVWATLGAGRFDRIALPDDVRRIVLLPDRDRAGEAAMARALAAYRAKGFAVETCWPPAGHNDWAAG